MGLYETFGTEKSYEQEGIRLQFGDSFIRVKRAGGSNNEFQKLLMKRMSPHKALLKNNLMPEEQAASILAEVYADSVIIGWENVTGPDGKPMEFTRENVIKLLIDLPDLFDAIREACTDHANFQQEMIQKETEDLKKN